MENVCINPKIAKDVGINAAIIYEHIKFCCNVNKNNNTNLHDGHYWTYGSKKTLAELFPYLNKGTIRTTLNNLVKKDYIVLGKYNKDKFDQTNWYRITNKNFLNNER